MFAWRAYARPIAVDLWAAFVNGDSFEVWERSYMIGPQEAPMDFLVEDKRARFQVRDKFGVGLQIGDVAKMAQAATNATGKPVEWLRIDNSNPARGILTVTFELSKLRVTAAGFKEVAA